MSEKERKMTRRGLLGLAGASAAAVLLPACLEDYEKEGEDAPTIPDENVLLLETPTPVVTHEVLREEFYFEQQLIEVDASLSKALLSEGAYEALFESNQAFYADRKDEYTGHYIRDLTFALSDEVLSGLSNFDESNVRLLNSVGNGDIGNYKILARGVSVYDVMNPRFLHPDNFGKRVMSVTIETPQNGPFGTFTSGENVRRVLGNDHYLVFDWANSQTEDVRREVYAMRQS